MGYPLLPDPQKLYPTVGKSHPISRKHLLETDLPKWLSETLPRELRNLHSRITKLPKPPYRPGKPRTHTYHMSSLPPVAHALTYNATVLR